MTRRLADMTPAERRTRVAQLVGNPSTRASIPTAFLPAKFKAQRRAAIFGKQPIVPGAMTTNADLAKQRQAAIDLKYGPRAVDKSVQAEKDQAGWFDEYRNALQTSQTNQAQIGQHGVDEINNLAGAFAAPNTAGFSAENADDATKAAAVRKAIIANLGGVQAANAASNNTYANRLANVVAPTQKLQARAKAAQDTEDLRGRIGADRVLFDADAQEKALAQVDAREKNVLSLKALGLDEKKTDADIDLRRGVDPVTGKPLPAETPTGYGPGGPAQNKYGYTYDEWNALPSTKQNSIRAGKDSKKSSGKPNNGKGWASNDKQATAQETIEKGINYTKSLLKRNGATSRAQAAQYLLASAPAQTVYEEVPVLDKNGKDTGKTKRQPVLVNGVPKTTGAKPAINSLFASVALDMAYDGHVSAHNVRRLHALGYRIDSLGYPTKAAPARSPSERAPGGT